MKALLDRTELFETQSYEHNKGSKTGILLIHGFTNTTYELKKLKDFLASKKIVFIIQHVFKFLNFFSFFSMRSRIDPCVSLATFCILVINDCIDI